MRTTKKIELMFCDCCDSPIQDIDDVGRVTWKKGVFQCGETHQKTIGTWCIEECFKEYFLTGKSQ